jgi:hypothetical protein
MIFKVTTSFIFYLTNSLKAFVEVFTKEDKKYRGWELYLVVNGTK